MTQESTANKVIKRQIRILPWGFIIPGVIVLIMGIIFTVLFNLFFSQILFFPFMAFFAYQSWLLIVIGITCIVIGVVLRHVLKQKEKKPGQFGSASDSLLSDEEPTTSSSAPAYAQNQSSFLLFPKYSLSRMGLYLLIYAIVALVLFYVIPWALLAGDGGSALVGYTLEDRQGDFLAGLASSGISSSFVYYVQGIGMVFTSYVLVIIMSICLLILGIIQLNFLHLSRILAILGIIFSFTVLLAGAWALIGDIRILSLHLLTIPQNAQFNFGENSFGIFPSAYIALVFAILFIKNSVKAIHLQRQLLEPTNVGEATPMAAPVDQGGQIDE